MLIRNTLMLLVRFRIGLCNMRGFEGVSYNLAVGVGWRESYAVPRSQKITETNQKYVQLQAYFFNLCKNSTQSQTVHTLQEHCLLSGPNIFKRCSRSYYPLRQKNTNTKIQVLWDVTPCKLVKHCYD
jgi:hypothetical protein